MNPNQGQNVSEPHQQMNPNQGAEWLIVWCYDGWHPVADRLESILPAWATLRRMDPSRPLCQQVADADVLIPTTGNVDEAVIRAAAGRCKLIAQPAAGFCNIALHVAKELGIPVTNAPGAVAAGVQLSSSLEPPRSLWSASSGSNAQSVAECALMMMLMLARRAFDASRVFQQRRIGEPVGMELCGKRLGIIGMGSIGSCLKRAALGLGMEVRRGIVRKVRRRRALADLSRPLGSRTLHLLCSRSWAPLPRPLGRTSKSCCAPATS